MPSRDKRESRVRTPRDRKPGDHSEERDRGRSRSGGQSGPSRFRRPPQEAAPSPMPRAVRQTASYLMRRFREIGIEPQTRYGQNFLIDLNLIDVLVQAARIQPTDIVLEVGTGTGSLTAILASQAAAVITVEIDQHLYALASETLIDLPNVTMVHFDALKNKNRLHPELLSTLDDVRARHPGSDLKLVANLPYNIATPLMSNLLNLPVPPASMTVTIQRELAERITAAPRTKDYSALSVWVQSQCDVEICRIMAPTVFWPRPKVESAILNVRLNAEKRARIPDRAYFQSFVRAMFFHRRKFLRSELLSCYKGRQIGRAHV